MVQIYKYAVQMTAAEAGKSATFMPKLIVGNNGNGVHIHQSLFNGDSTIFGGNDYGGLSQEALDPDRDFLKQGDVYSDGFIDGYIALKREECQEFAETPHPIEFKLYYSF